MKFHENPSLGEELFMWTNEEVDRQTWRS